MSNEFYLYKFFKNVLLKAQYLTKSHFYSWFLIYGKVHVDIEWNIYHKYCSFPFVLVQTNSVSLNSWSGLQIRCLPAVLHLNLIFFSKQKYREKVWNDHFDVNEMYSYVYFACVSCIVTVWNRYWNQRRECLLQPQAPRSYASFWQAFYLINKIT